VLPPCAAAQGRLRHGVSLYRAGNSFTHRARSAYTGPRPLAGLWTHQKGGFYHDGRFATLRDVLEHYNSFFKLGLGERQKTELTEYLKSL